MGGAATGNIFFSETAFAGWQGAKPILIIIIIIIKPVSVCIADPHGIHDYTATGVLECRAQPRQKPPPLPPPPHTSYERGKGVHVPGGSKDQDHGARPADPRTRHPSVGIDRRGRDRSAHWDGAEPAEPDSVELSVALTACTKHGIGIAGNQAPWACDKIQILRRTSSECHTGVRGRGHGARICGRPAHNQKKRKKLRSQIPVTPRPTPRATERHRRRPWPESADTSSDRKHHDPHSSTS